jgi:hypothetical protein
MIAYGCAIANEEKYRRYALAGMERVREDGAPLVEVRGRRCLFRAYNEILERVRGEDGLEALVLLHEDAEIRDERFAEKIREVLRDEDIAIVGALGGIGVHDLDWWEHDRAVGAVFLDLLDGMRTYGTSLVETGRMVGPGGSGEVDAVDGMLLVLSPWAVRELSFDESLGPGRHGYDIDICFQARERGKKVFVVEFDVTHHRDSVTPGDQREPWKQAHIRFRRKWERRFPLPAPSWEPRRTGV